MEFYEKIMKVQSELKAPKNQFNKFGNYKYRSQEDILEALKPLLAQYKLIQVISDEVVLIGERYYIKATVSVYDVENGTSLTGYGYARETDVKKGMDESQITGSASSYARKYALNGFWGIDDVKDADTMPPEDKKPNLSKALQEAGINNSDEFQQYTEKVLGVKVMAFKDLTAAQRTKLERQLGL